MRVCCGGKIAEEGAKGLQLLCSKGHRGEQLEMEGSLSYMWVSTAGHSLYLGEKGYKKARICSKSSAFIH